MHGIKGLSLLALAATTCFLLTYYVVDSELAATIVHVNNDAQTKATENDLPVEDGIKMQQEILSMYGVPIKPKNTPENVKGSAPKFLYNVYKSLERHNEQADEHHEDKKMRNVLSYVGKLNDRVVQESDEIVTLYMSNYSNDVHDENGFEIIFDINEVSSVEETRTIMSAEVYLYKTASLRNVENGVYSITVYQIINGKNGDTRLEYLDSQNVAAEYDGWLHFNTTIVLVTWTHGIYPNRGLYVKVQPLDEVSALFEDEDEYHDQDVISLKEGVKKPFMVVYLKNNRGSEVRDVPQINHSSVTVLQKKVDHQSSKIHNGINPYQLFMIQTLNLDSNVNLIGYKQKE